LPSQSISLAINEEWQRPVKYLVNGGKKKKKKKNGLGGRPFLFEKGPPPPNMATTLSGAELSLSPALDASQVKGGNGFYMPLKQVQSGRV